MLDRRLEVGAPIKVEMQDAMMLAEVCFTNPAPHGFVAGLRIDQILSGLTDLRKLNAQLGFNQSMASTAYSRADAAVLAKA